MEGGAMVIIPLSAFFRAARFTFKEGSPILQSIADFVKTSSRI
jgi:hypothetical protein